jgi:voltage-gated potassium channel
MPLLFAILRRRHWQRYRYMVRQVDIRWTLLKAALYLGTVFALHSWIMVAFEGLSPHDAVWLTLTTVVTVGYGDFAAATTFGRLATVVLIYFGGIFVLFHVAADYFEFRTERKMAILRGRWRWRMEDHVLLLNAPTINRDRYLLGLVDELRRTERYQHCPVMMLTRDYPAGLPEELQEAGVVHYHGDATTPEDLIAADAGTASVLLVLAESAEDKRSDELTFDIIDRLREVGARGRIIAECIRRANRARLKRAGADCVMRPVRFYPEIVVRAIDAPGTELILENLFTNDGDECRGFEVSIENAPWCKVAGRLMSEGLGTALAYADSDDGSLHCNPEPDHMVSASMIYLIVKQSRAVDRRKVRAALQDLER